MSVLLRSRSPEFSVWTLLLTHTAAGELLKGACTPVAVGASQQQCCCFIYYFQSFFFVNSLKHFVVAFHVFEVVSMKMLFDTSEAL